MSSSSFLLPLCISLHFFHFWQSTSSSYSSKKKSPLSFFASLSISYFLLFNFCFSRSLTSSFYLDIPSHLRPLCKKCYLIMYNFQLAPFLYLFFSIFSRFPENSVPKFCAFSSNHLWLDSHVKSPLMNEFIFPNSSVLWTRIVFLYGPSFKASFIQCLESREMVEIFFFFMNF